MICDHINDILNSQVESSSLSSLCLFVKENINAVPQMSIQQLADACHISKGQVSKCIRMLDFKNYEEFRSACLQQIHSFSRHRQFYSSSISNEENIRHFTESLTAETEYVTQHLPLNELMQLIGMIRKAHHVYIYARADARSYCYQILREFNIRQISCTLCDSDFKKDYAYHKNDLLLIISTNGNLFTFDQRLVRRLKEASVYKYLITCQNLSDFNQTLIIKTHNPAFNEYSMRHVLDLMMLLL